ncbi:MAG: nucleotide exchange factor GrpE [Ardenticatenaceae bacterium]|nr:nucleotide exchange factor GrpE [Ardenticatenaceae bacterium]
MDWDPFWRGPRRQRRRPLTPAEQRRRQREEAAQRRAEEAQRRQAADQQPHAGPPGQSEPLEEGKAGPAPAQGASPVSQAIIAEFEKELAAARRERDEWEEKHLRTLAETQNLRQRLQRNAEERALEENRRVLRRFLDVADNLERALDAANGVEAGSPLAEGVRLTYRELERALTDAGVRPLAPLGQPFDPNYHEAVATIQAPHAAAGTVVEEVQKGYTFQDKLLRPAKVVVAG